MTTAATGSRQARAAETRRRIVDAARELFVSNGYRSTSLRDIAAAASVSHPGLLGHFASKDDLLAEVVAGFEDDNEKAFDLIAAASEPGGLIFADVARRNARTPGYLELFAALTGEASAPEHPAHERMRKRYARLRALSSDVLEDAALHGTIESDRDVSDETTRHIAGWDGLQLISQYLPDRVDVVQMLEERESLWALPVGWRDADQPSPAADAAGPLPALDATAVEGAPEIDPGYAVGRRRRAQILADAMRLFSRTGYGDTSLRDIAAAVGVSKSTLLHHYASKELLLSAVLSERDRSIQERTAAHRAERAADVLRAIHDGARVNALDEPGLIEVYAVLSCEAVPAAHPAHDYFTERFRRVIDHFAELFRLAQVDGDLPDHRDPEHEAVWLLALWDGLQYQWLYDRDAVDVAAHLRAHLEDVLPRV
ncbi:TetR/AcrR family transcriptional regulator [Microbacterium sp. Leaf320]|uniref:TetR/AcrR family transcriptional regulator n=1 Tax=Microbacterium sp. Leaf320 TaxID=1736334 RepID=UPI0006F5D566|nr:TetR/AcrR family transcriptional regulator [Microbacterium sp. Leaf320]KQQ66633.1 TetR family transcriptional regulator [Microbacterium sp. Leaf320]